MKWLCDCTIWKDGERQTPKYYGRFFPTCVDSENKCTICGHYAICESQHKKFTRGQRIGGYEPIASPAMLYKTMKLSGDEICEVRGEPLWREMSAQTQKERKHENKK